MPMAASRAAFPQFLWPAFHVITTTTYAGGIPFKLPGTQVQMGTTFPKVSTWPLLDTKNAGRQFWTESITSVRVAAKAMMKQGNPFWKVDLPWVDIFLCLKDAQLVPSYQCNMEEEMDPVPQIGENQQGMLCMQLKMMFIPFSPFLSHLSYQDPASSAWLLLVGWISQIQKCRQSANQVPPHFWEPHCQRSWKLWKWFSWVDGGDCTLLLFEVCADSWGSLPQGAAEALDKHSLLHHESQSGNKAERI